MEIKKWDISQRLNSKEIRREYLSQVLADGDVDEIQRALFYVAQAEGVDSKNCYESSNENQKSYFESIYKMLQALNIKLVVAN